jgi:hypothetical protein
MTRYLAGVTERGFSFALRHILVPLVDRYSSQPLTSAGLVISVAGATTAKIGAADFYASVAGDLVKIAAGTAMPALTGVNITAANFNVACFFVDGAGAVTLAAGVQAATLAGVVWPDFPKNKALIGFLIITNAGAFTGGTTPLDTATTIFVSPLGAFDPTVLI